MGFAASRPVSESARAFWLGTGPRVPVAARALRAGLHTIEVVCAGPRYVTLHVAFRDASLAPLFVPLDVAAPRRYRKTFLLAGEAREAWIECAPSGGPGDALSLEAKPIGWRTLAALGWRAARRHMGSPRAFLSKARQVASGAGALVFSAHGGDGAGPDDIYRNWREAFESEDETQRIAAALERRIGRRAVRVLAVVAAWEHGPERLGALLRSLALARGAEVGVLALTAGDMRAARRGDARFASWEHHPCGPEAAMPMSVVARAIERTGAGLVLFLDRPGLFHELAVTCLAAGLAQDPAARAVYADHDRLDAAGRRRDPLFKPAWSPDYETAWDYVAQPVAFRGDPGFFAELGDFGSPLCPSFGILMRLAAMGAGDAAVGHVPRVLFHEQEDAGDRRALERRAAERRVAEDVLRQEVEAVRPRADDPVVLRRVRRFSRGGEPGVSVIIPSKDNPDMLARACRAVTAARHAAAEIVIVDNGSTSRGQRKLLSELAGNAGVRVARDPRPFNFSRLINLGRAEARGEILILLNDDVEALDEDWLSELASNARRPGVGCVGALLLYPDRRVQHAGVVLGVNGCAGHAFRHAPEDSQGDGHRLEAVHEVTAVTAACLAVRAHVFDEAGGFAEDLPVTLNDVDFCLKARERGYRNLFTPYAKLIHRESASRGLDATPSRLRRLSRETAIFRRRWGEGVLEDAFYSPHLSLGHEDFRLRPL